MAIQTYITSAEATLFYSNDGNFSAGAKTLALSTSFGLVNAYISSKLTLPVIGQWDGESTIEAPSVLKIAQSKLYQWILETSNVGETPELKELFDNTVEMLRGITDNELGTPQQLVYSVQSGWHVVNVTNSATSGAIYVRGTAPALKTFYSLIGTHTGTKYAGDVVYSVFRSDSATARSTGNLGNWDWRAVDSAFEVRFDGQWASGFDVRIVGVPSEAVNVATPSNALKQGPLNYGPSYPGVSRGWIVV